MISSVIKKKKKVQNVLPNPKLPLMRLISSLFIGFIAFFIFGKSNKTDLEYLPIDKARYKVVYQMNFIEDTVKRKINDTYATLLIGDSIVTYGDKHKIDSDSVSYTYRKQNNGKKLNPMQLLSTIMGVKFTHQIYLNYPRRDSLTVTASIVGSKCYTESRPVQNWTETGRSKTIFDLNCKEAVCSYRGRDYVAYYCPDIPLSYGPDVFGGLPGLIMELHDGKQEYAWNLVGFEPCNYGHEITINMKDVQKLSREEFRAADLHYKQNPWLAFPDAPMARKFKPKPYNPVEKY